MKYIAIFILLFSFFALYCFELDTSLKIRSSRTEGEVLDYEVAVMCKVDSLVFVECEYVRQGGRQFRNFELVGWQHWKSFRFTGKYIGIEEDSLKFIAVDARYKVGKGITLGLVEMWDLKAQTMIIVGHDVKWSFKVPLLLPVSFSSTTNVYTKDLKKFDSETDIFFSMKVSSVIHIYFRYKQRFFDKWKFSSNIGIGVSI